VKLTPHTLVNLTDNRRSGKDQEVVEIQVIISEDPMEAYLAYHTGDFTFDDLLSFPGGWGINVSGAPMIRFPARIGQIKCCKVTANGCGLLWLPSELCDMKALKKLEFQNNNLASLPKDFGRLENLEELDLMNNRLGDTPLAGTKGEAFETPIPESFGLLQKLHTLKLGCNPLKVLPEPICRLAGLESLMLSDTGLKELPAAIGGLTGLKFLHLSQNPLEDLPETIFKLANLEWLQLEKTPLAEDFKKKPNARLLLALMAKLYSLRDIIAKRGQTGMPEVIQVLLERIDEFILAGETPDSALGKLMEMTGARPP